MASFLSVETKSILTKVLFSSKQGCAVFWKSNKKRLQDDRSKFGKSSVRESISSQLCPRLTVPLRPVAMYSWKWRECSVGFLWRIELSTRKRASIVASLQLENDCFLSLWGQTMTDLTFGHTHFCCLTGDFDGCTTIRSTMKDCFNGVFIVLVGGVLADLLSFVKSGIFRSCLHFVTRNYFVLRCAGTSYTLQWKKSFLGAMLALPRWWRPDSSDIASRKHGAQFASRTFSRLFGVRLTYVSAAISVELNRQRIFIITSIIFFFYAFTHFIHESSISCLFFCSTDEASYNWGETLECRSVQRLVCWEFVGDSLSCSLRISDKLSPLVHSFSRLCRLCREL